MAHEILVSAQGPLVLDFWVFGVWGQGLTIMMDRSCVRQPRVDRTVWNTSLSIYAPNNMLQVVFKMNTDDHFEKSEHIKIRFFYL